MSVTIGTVVLAFDGAANVTLEHAMVRASVARYDRAQHRAPYGTAWFTSGTGEREPQVFEVTAYAYAPSLVAAAPIARDIINDLNNAAAVNAPGVGFLNAGVAGVSMSPVESGYRIDARLIASAAGVYAPGPVTFNSDPVTFNDDPVVWLGG